MIELLHTIKDWWYPNEIFITQLNGFTLSIAMAWSVYLTWVIIHSWAGDEFSYHSPRSILVSITTLILGLFLYTMIGFVFWFIAPLFAVALPVFVISIVLNKMNKAVNKDNCNL